ncbi:MAG: glycosyltransferase family 4 protein [Gemmatimonadota bacterium]
MTAFPRAPGDVITPWLSRMLSVLRGRGLEVEVLAPSYRGLASSQWEGVPVHRFRYAPARLETLTHDETVPDRLRRSPAYAALLPSYLLGGVLTAFRLGRNGRDVVHVHWPMPHALFGAALRRASGGKTALVCSYYSVELSWVDRRLPWLRPYLRWSARTADGVTAISSATAARVRELAGREVPVIPFSSALEDGDWNGRGEPFSDSGPIRLLFVGRLVERKGVEVLLRALSLVLERREAQLTIVGAGEWESKLREVARETGVEDRVRFLGFIPEAQLQDQYAACDIFVLPAVVDRKGDTEGLGVVLLEALRFARPVIASAVGGIPDIVRQGETGWLVPPNDSRALANRILLVASNPSRARRVGSQGKALAERRFSWAGIADRLIGVYERAILERSGHGGPRSGGSEA